MKNKGFMIYPDQMADLPKIGDKYEVVSITDCEDIHCGKGVFVELRYLTPAAPDSKKRCLSCGSTNLEYDGTCIDC